MALKVRDVMTPEPTTVPASTTLAAAAQAMRDRDLGGLLVADETNAIIGIVSDRDIVVRGLAEGAAGSTPVGTLVSTDLSWVEADDDVVNAVQLMRDKAIRRLPVRDGGRLVGVITIGDLAKAIDPESALADISAAPPNNGT
jgi:CBS domain-containing protein